MQRPHRLWGRRKLVVLGLGALGLAGALTLAAFAAPARQAAAAATYTPAEDAAVVARVPTRDPDELSARRTLAAAPDRVELAVSLARADIRRYRTLSDPRFLGRAQATLAPWWSLAEPPQGVLLLRATIRQSLHDFDGAKADLDRVVARPPAADGDAEDAATFAQAHLTRAVVATVTADYARARESCAAIARLASPLVAATCEAPLDAIAGKADRAYESVSRALAGARRADAGVRGWALTQLAELALVRGDRAAAAQHLRAALALDTHDAYARNLLADVLLLEGRAREASLLLAGKDAIDSHLVRRAIAEHQSHGPDEQALVRAMRERIAAAALRGDRIHLREEAMFALAVLHDPKAAVALARDNWAVQKELADARLLAEAAAAASDADAARPVLAWARTNGLRDAQLEIFFARLEAR
ncbi:MAG TPA: hypothetical protein VNO30_20425 [Kofleriaceae bacterium]|nr:hypothetical protein [Kofleriaceae bacterium]